MRWTKPSFALFAVLGGVGMLGCSESAASRSLSPSASSVSFDREGAEAKEIVTAGVEFFIPEGPGVMTAAKYAMEAHRDWSGEVKGELEIEVARDPRQRFHGRITCFSVVGNTAHLGAMITQSNVSFAGPGTFFAWTVADNGEGKRSAPDQTSTFFIVTQQQAEAHCANGGIHPPLFPVAHGNIQVH